MSKRVIILIVCLAIRSVTKGEEETNRKEQIIGSPEGDVSWCDPDLCGCAEDIQHIACQNYAVLLN